MVYSGGLHTGLGLGAILVVGGYIAELLFGLPFYVALRWVGQVGNRKAYIFTGAASGLLLGLVAVLLGLAAPGVGVVPGIFLGPLAGWLFWLVENYRSPPTHV